MTVRFFGLDGEMTGADLASGDRLIQIGVAAHADIDGNVLDVPELYVAVLNPGPSSWSMRAQGVHGFTQADIAAARPAAEVDAELEAWLIARGLDEGSRGGAIPIGFNVGQFDMPFVKQSLPRTYALFSRRSVDLNSLCFTLDGLPSAKNDTTPTSWAGWKNLAKTYAERVLAEQATAYGAENTEHDAGYDALMAVHIWRFLRSHMAGAPLVMPQTPVPTGEAQLLATALLHRFGREQAAARCQMDAEILIAWSLGGRATDTDAILRMRAVAAEQ